MSKLLSQQEALPIAEFALDKGGGGNWDDKAIEAVIKRLGFQLKVGSSVKLNVKSPFKDDLGPLALVRELRNRLAHGSISFSQCTENFTVDDLIDLKDKTANYLLEVVKCFDTYLEKFEYLVPNRRPE